MRKLYHCALFLCTLSSALAQSQYQQAADNAFANLNKSGVTSRVLYDRVFPGADLSNFNATTTSSATHYVQARAELYGASYNTGNQLTIDELKNLIWQSKQQNIIPIGVTLAQFQVVNYDVIEFDSDQRYRLRAGHTDAEVYQNRQVTVAAILTPAVPHGTSAFQLPEWATLSNRANLRVNSISVNFGDGNPVRTLTPGNTTVLANFQHVGETTIQYTVNLSDGSQQRALSTVTVSNTESTYCNICVPVPPRDGIGKIEPLIIDGYEAFQGYEESVPSKGKGDAYIYYARGREQVRKPVIILDGFDPGDTRSAQDIYDLKLRYRKNDGSSTPLGDELRENDADNNSDLIILNFPVYTYQGCISNCRLMSLA